MIDTTIGSDPEFMIIDSNGEILPAVKILSGCDDCNPCDTCSKTRDEDACVRGCGGDCDVCHMCSSEPGNCDSCYECQEPLEHSEVGIDGNSTVGELRPIYSFDPIMHHAAIKSLIRHINLPKEYKLLGGTVQCGFKLGGHIHIGYNESGIDNDHFAKYLSYYCGIPLKRIENPDDIECRGKYEETYGYYGSYHDTDYGIEFRMPASWLVDSTIAKAALCLAKVVAYEYLNVDSSADVDLSHDEYVELLDARNIDDIIEEIKDMEEFSKYANEINPLLTMIENHQTWDTDKNIRENWK